MSTEKRHDIIADTLTIREMAAIIDGLTALSVKLSNESLQYHRSPERSFIWELRRLIEEAHSTAQRNEHAGDYDYPE